MARLVRISRDVESVTKCGARESVGWPVENVMSVGHLLLEGHNLLWGESDGWLKVLVTNCFEKTADFWIEHRHRQYGHARRSMYIHLFRPPITLTAFIIPLLSFIYTIVVHLPSLWLPRFLLIHSFHIFVLASSFFSFIVFSRGFLHSFRCTALYPC